MPTTVHTDRLAAAMARFKAFFEELHETFVERDEVLHQCALALLARHHLLITGPPGTAKSALARAVLGRIMCDISGRPSMFSRQFTESTVQTDLVGPIDFKTLTETGRTAHFTDEGILGAHHAFLDEVFDGRDMLLRSTLNLLQEREFKQGGEIAEGQIETAFMTSNRYISEILDNARDTLLAFIDRVPFVSFVPRGFADPANMKLVVRQHGGGFGRHTPTAPLSIQDLDVLQAAADLIYVPEEICDLLTVLIDRLDVELHEARRSDPTFQPTRYMSTRTAVNSTGLLRAVALYDRIFHNPDRPLQVGVKDLAGLRYSLVLTGVDPSALSARINEERDPRERRQLEIMRTESEIFDRVLAKLPVVSIPNQPRTLKIEQLREVVANAHQSRHGDALEDAVRTLVGAFESGAENAKEAADLLVTTVSHLSEDALKAGLTQSATSEATLVAFTSRLASVATSLERAAGRYRPMARWLRGRLLHIVDEAVALSTQPSEEMVREVLQGAPPKTLTARIDERLGEIERLHTLRTQLAGADGVDDRTAGWQKGLSRVEGEVALLWDTKFRHTAKAFVKEAKRAKLSQVLTRLQPTGKELEAVAGRLESIGLHHCKLPQRVLGPRVEPLIARAMRDLDVSDRPKAIEEFKAVVHRLEAVSLGAVIPPERMVAWVATPLIRDEGPRQKLTAVAVDQASYANAKQQEASLSLTETLMEMAIVAVPADKQLSEAPEGAVEGVRNVLRALPEATRREVAELDLARVRRGVVCLESWWKRLAEGHERAAKKPGLGVTLLEKVVSSGFLRVLRTDREATRLALEAKHIGEVFEHTEAAVAEIHEAIQALDRQATDVVVGLLQGHSDRAWDAALSDDG